MAKTKIGSNATFSGTQKGLTVLGDHCMAYSGEYSVDNTETFLLDFFSPGKRYIIGEVQLGSKANEDEDYAFKIYFNGLIVFSAAFSNQGQHNIGSWPIPIMIPPATEVKMSLDNISDTDSRVWTVHLVGRVYA